MTQNMESMQAAPRATTAVLRLLNGALRGGEFALEQGITLIVARSPQALQHDAGQAEFPDNAIFVPVDDEGGNFEVEISADEDGATAIALRDLTVSEAADEAVYVPNTVRRIAGLDIALRAEGDAWSEEVRNYGMQAPAAVEEIAVAAPSQKKPQRTKLFRMAGIALAVALLTGTAGALWWIQAKGQKEADPVAVAQESRSTQLTQAEQLAQDLRGDGSYRVLPGRDGQMYVFAASEREAGWAQQSIVRAEDKNGAGKIRVLRNYEEIRRIEKMLDGLPQAPAYHIVRLANPAVPEIWLSRERAPLTAAASKELAKKMTALLPYADQVEIRWIDDAEIAKQAEAGLERLGVQHKKIDNGASVTMSIRGALPDGELQKVRSYVESFYRQWGTHYVHYAVELADDVRKGKSFEYGSESYVKSSASHWDFSSQI